MTRAIHHSSEFKRDYKREAKGRFRASLDDDLFAVLQLLSTDAMLEARYRDHSLTGSWNGYRECHIKPDLLLLYRKAGPDLLQLARLGSHSELFG